MRLIPYSFNGYIIQTQRRIVSWFEDPFSWSNIGVSANYTKRGGEFPVFASKNFSETQKVLKVSLNDPETDRDLLIQNFDIMERSLKILLATDSQTGIRYSLECTPIAIISGDKFGTQWSITLDCPNPYWVSAITKNAAMTAIVTGQKVTATVGGNYYVKPTITLTLNTQKSTGYPYKRYITVINKSQNALTRYPVDVTNGGFNTSTPIGAGKMQADGDDLRVIINGTEVSRYLDGINSATTKVWVNLNIKPSPLTAQAPLIYNTLLNTTLTVSSIQIKPPYYYSSGGHRVYKISTFNASGIFRINNEEFTYASKVDKDGIFYGIVRGARGTTLATHTANDEIKSVENDIVMIYGDATVGAPDQDAELIPCLNLSTSTNTSWVYSTFGNDQGVKPCQFAPAVQMFYGDQSEFYTAVQHAENVDPYTVMGMSVESYVKSGVNKAGNAKITWSLNHPVGITRITTVGGKKNRASVSWPNISGLRKVIGSKDSSVFNLATPTLVNTWQSWSETPAAFATTVNQIYFIHNGIVGASANNTAELEVSSLTLALDATKSPTVYFGNESTTGYRSNLELRNETTGDSLFFNYPLQVADSIGIDTENRTARRVNDELNVIGGILYDQTRLEWFKLEPGANVISVWETGIQSVYVAFSWHDRFK